MDSDTVPSLGDRHLGDAPTQDGETVEWSHFLPFMAQSVIDRGFDLPNPYGAAAVFYAQNQDVLVSDLKVSLNGSDPVAIDFLQIGTGDVENVVAQGKIDAWLLPFMNVYVTGGYVSGQVGVPLSIDGADLLDFLNLGGLCTGGPLQPGLCTRSYSEKISPEYRGGNVTLGTVLAVGWRQFFAITNFSYTWSWIDLIDTTVNAIYFSPRVGITGDMGDLGSIQGYVGAGFLYNDMRLAGSITLTPEQTGQPSPIDIDFSLRQQNKDRWNFVVGTNWDVRRWLSVQAEVGFAGSRSNVIVSSTYRF